MTKEKLKVVLVKQLSDYDKRLRSDFIIPTGLGKAHSFRHTVRALHQLGAL
jgi:dephospho-CoA kinase